MRWEWECVANIKGRGVKKIHHPRECLKWISGLSCVRLINPEHMSQRLCRVKYENKVLCLFRKADWLNRHLCVCVCVFFLFILLHWRFYGAALCVVQVVQSLKRSRRQQTQRNMRVIGCVWQRVCRDLFQNSRRMRRADSLLGVLGLWQTNYTQTHTVTHTHTQSAWVHLA